LGVAMRIHTLTTITAVMLSVSVSAGTRASLEWGERARKDTDARSSQNSASGSVEGIGRISSGSNAQGGAPVIRDDGIHTGAGSGSGVGRGSGGLDGGRAVTGGDGIHIGVGRGVPVIGGVPIIVIAGAVQPRGGSQPVPGKFGIASECEPSCSVKRTPTGEYYYKYDSYPRVVQVRKRSAADRAGVQVGDLIVEVEGRSILEDGSIVNLEQRDRLRMTVRRDDKAIDVALVIP
jgi:hypothetical protein